MLRLYEFTYHRPAALGEALELLDRHAGDVMLVAGGTDVVPNMKHRLFSPGHVVSLRSLPELRGIEERDGELWIGAAETLSAVARDPRVAATFPSLALAAGSVAGPQLRNMGTIGGNLCLDTRCTYYNQTFFWRNALGFCLKKDGDVCHVTRVGKKCVAAHSADTPPVLMTLGARAVLHSLAGVREVAVQEFFVSDGVWNTVRRPDEVLIGIRIPLPRPGLRTGYQKLRQRHSIDFPLLSVAAAVELAPGGEVEALRIVVTTLGARPRILTAVEEIARGRRLAGDAVEAVAARAFDQCRPLTNIGVDPEWRRAMVPVYVRRALASLAS